MYLYTNHHTQHINGIVSRVQSNQLIKDEASIFMVAISKSCNMMKILNDTKKQKRNSMLFENSIYIRTKVMVASLLLHYNLMARVPTYRLFVYKN